MPTSQNDRVEEHVIVDDDLATGRLFADVDAYWNAIVQQAREIN